MKFKKKIFAVFLIIFLISIVGVSAADTDNATITSDSESPLLEQDTEANVGVSSEPVLSNDTSGNFSELQMKVLLAPEGSTVALDKDYTYDNKSITSGIIINKNLTIDGNGHTLNGLSKSRIFTILYGEHHNQNVILKNINFKNGYTDGYGGAILNFAELKVDNCTFTNNYAYYCGGAINSLGHLTCTNSKFTKNKADGDGGAIFTFSVKNSFYIYAMLEQSLNISMQTGFSPEILMQISGLLQVNFTLNYLTDEISNCVFKSNVANGRGGGAVYAFSHVKITSSTFTSNKAGEKGGAVFANKNLNIAKSKFTGNTASKYGGAVYFKCHGSTGHYEGKKWVSEIEYYTGSITGSTFSKNSASKGGAIYGFKSSSSDKHSAKVSKCTFTANKATSGRDTYGVSASGCVYNYLKLTLNSVTIKKSASKLVLTSKLTKGKTLIKGKTITFKFNGKTYKAKTNSKGIAKVTIKKTILQKLTVGKNVKYSSKYGSLSVAKKAKVKK